MDWSHGARHGVPTPRRGSVDPPWGPKPMVLNMFQHKIYTVYIYIYSIYVYIIIYTSCIYVYTYKCYIVNILNAVLHTFAF